MPPPTQTPANSPLASSNPSYAQSLLDQVTQIRLSNEATNRYIKAQNNAAEQLGKGNSAFVNASLVLGSYIGSRLIPGMSKGIESFANIRLAMQGLTGKGAFGSTLGTVFGGVALGTEVLTGALKSLSSSLLSLSAAANPGGMKILEDSIGLAMAMLGQKLAPLLPVMAAQVLAFAETLSEDLKPVMDEMPTIITKVVVPALALLGKTLLDVGKWIADAIVWILKNKDKLWDFNKAAIHLVTGGVFDSNNPVYNGGRKPGVPPTGQKTDADGKPIPGTSKSPESDKVSEFQQIMDAMTASIKNIDDARTKALNDPNKAPRESPDARFSKWLNLIVTQQTRNLAEQYGVVAKFSGIGDVWKENQIRSMQKPLEQKMLETQQKALEETKKIARNTDPKKQDTSYLLKF